MRVSAKVDYAVRALLTIVAAGGSTDHPVKGDRIAQAQAMPIRFLENILSELRQDGLVRSRRGAEGGYWLGRPATEITVADVVRAVEGPLANVRGERPETLEYAAGTGSLQDLWIATRAALRSVLEQVTIAQLAAGELPSHVQTMVDDPEAWHPH